MFKICILFGFGARTGSDAAVLGKIVEVIRRQIIENIIDNTVVINTAVHHGRLVTVHLQFTSRTFILLLEFAFIIYFRIKLLMYVLCTYKSVYKIQESKLKHTKCIKYYFLTNKNQMYVFKIKFCSNHLLDDNLLRDVLSTFLLSYSTTIVLYRLRFYLAFFSTQIFLGRAVVVDRNHLRPKVPL